MNRNILKSSLQNASFSIIFQIFCRCITFGINSFIVRRVGRDVLGIMNVRLLLLESTLIFLSKEAISRAALSFKNKSSWPHLINQIWISVPICIMIAIPFLYIWLYLLSAVDDSYSTQYKFGCFAIAFSCIIEMTAEVPVFVGQVFCFVKLKIILDTLHILVRSLIFILLVTNNKNIAIYAFGIAQISSALTIIVGNYLFFHIYIKKLKEYHLELKKNDSLEKIEAKFGPYYANMDDFPFNGIKEMLPGILKNSGNKFNSDLQILILSFAKQGILKQVLTEGEKYVMSVSPVLSFSEQATYDIVNNMGSLAARFIFRPIEDSSYFYFTQTIARDIKLKDQNQEKVDESGQVLSNLFKAVTSIGLLGFIFGQSFSGTLLLLYGGSDFVSGGLPEMLLRWHCLAIVLLGVNGITEGYMFSTNTSKEIDTYNYYMAIFSITFLFLSYQLTNMLGPVGFILANCTNMLFRISYSTYYIYIQYRALSMNPLQGIIPGKLFFSILITMGLICKISEMRILKYSILYHIIVGGACTLITLCSWWYENKSLIKSGLDKSPTNPLVQFDSNCLVGLSDLHNHAEYKRSQRKLMDRESYKHYRWYNSILQQELYSAPCGFKLQVFHWSIESGINEAFNINSTPFNAVTMIIGPYVEHWYGANTNAGNIYNMHGNQQRIQPNPSEQYRRILPNCSIVVASCNLNSSCAMNNSSFQCRQKINCNKFDSLHSSCKCVKSYETSTDDEDDDYQDILLFKISLIKFSCPITKRKYNLKLKLKSAMVTIIEE